MCNSEHFQRMRSDVVPLYVVVWTIMHAFSLSCYSCLCTSEICSSCFALFAADSIYYIVSANVQNWSFDCFMYFASKHS